MKALEQSKYLSKEEAIERLAIDLVMDDSTLSLEHENITTPGFEYSGIDLINENMHHDCMSIFINDLLDFKDVQKLRSDCSEFLIKQAVIYIEQKINEGYLVGFK